MKTIGPIQCRYLPLQLIQGFSAFSERLGAQIQAEFGLPEAPTVSADEFVGLGEEKPELRLNAQLVGNQYGKLVDIVAGAVHEHARSLGVELGNLRYA